MTQVSSLKILYSHLMKSVYFADRNSSNIIYFDSKESFQQGFESLDLGNAKLACWIFENQLVVTHMIIIKIIPSLLLGWFWFHCAKLPSRFTWNKIICKVAPFKICLMYNLTVSHILYNVYSNLRSFPFQLTFHVSTILCTSRIMFYYKKQEKIPCFFM